MDTSGFLVPGVLGELLFWCGGFVVDHPHQGQLMLVVVVVVVVAVVVSMPVFVLVPILVLVFTLTLLRSSRREGEGVYSSGVLLLPPAEWNLCMFSHTAKHIIVSIPAFVLVPILFLILILTLLRSSREEGGFIVLVLVFVAFGGVESLYL